MTVSSTSLLTEELRRRKLQFSTAVSGKQDQPPRWKECVNVASGSFGAATGALYVRKYFKQDSKAAALEMVEAIRKEFVEILEAVPWMDEKTKTAALSKAKNMTHHIGYPDELMDDAKIVEYYKTVSVDENKYFESILNIGKFGTDRSFKKLREPVNKTEWINHAGAAVVNAYYSPNKNSIGELIFY